MYHVSVSSLVNYSQLFFFSSYLTTLRHRKCRASAFEWHFFYCELFVCLRFDTWRLNRNESDAIACVHLTLIKQQQMITVTFSWHLLQLHKIVTFMTNNQMPRCILCKTFGICCFLFEFDYDDLCLWRCFLFIYSHQLIWSIADRKVTVLSSIAVPISLDWWLDPISKCERKYNNKIKRKNESHDELQAEKEN